jgi:hypothetical protein
MVTWAHRGRDKQLGHCTGPGGEDLADAEKRVITFLHSERLMKPMHRIPVGVRFCRCSLRDTDPENAAVTDNRSDFDPTTMLFDDFLSDE